MWHADIARQGTVYHFVWFNFTGIASLALLTDGLKYENVDGLVLEVQNCSNSNVDALEIPVLC